MIVFNVLDTFDTIVSSHQHFDELDTYLSFCLQPGCATEETSSAPLAGLHNLSLVTMNLVLAGSNKLQLTVLSAQPSSVMLSQLQQCCCCGRRLFIVAQPLSLWSPLRGQTERRLLCNVKRKHTHYLFNCNFGGGGTMKGSNRQNRIIKIHWNLFFLNNT